MIPFDEKLSLELDRAQEALDEAQARGDKVREKYIQAWKRRLEVQIFEGGQR